MDVKPKFFSRASENFYSAFYQQLFDRYANYDDLPKKWRKEKYKTAKCIAELVEGQTKIMSVGCGLGYVERCVVEFKPRCHIDAYDLSKDAGLWLQSVEGVRVIQGLDQGHKYDFVYCTQLLYALTDKEIYDFAIFVQSVLDERGVFLTVDTSLDDRENGVMTTSRVRIKQKIKALFSPIYYGFRYRNKCQFWGWARDNSVVVRIFREAGFEVDDFFPAVGQSFLIFRVCQAGDPH